MSVELEPVELGFKRPFTHEVSQVLRLHNPNSDPVAFKVKTTAPKQYCVRPNSGRIESGRNVEVQVLLQAMKEDPTPDARCRDKFLVQSVAITAPNDIGNVSQIWQNIEQNAKGSIQEKKIRVSFLPADSQAGRGMAAGTPALGGGAAGGATTNGVSHPDDEPPAYSSPTASMATPGRQSAASPTQTMSTPSDSKTTRDMADSTHMASAEQSTMLGSAAAAISSVVPTSQDELKRQLDAANAKIQQLQQQVTDGLRQRTSTKPSAAGPGEKSASATSAGQGSMDMKNAPAPGGVPVHIVAALCLLCFVVAYIFF